MAAGHAIGLVQRQEQVESSLDIRTLGEPFIGQNFLTQLCCEGLEGLHATQIGAGHEMAGSVGSEPCGEPVGLRLTSFGEWTQTVIALPERTLASMGMAGEVDRHGRTLVNPGSARAPRTQCSRTVHGAVDPSSRHTSAGECAQCLDGLSELRPQRVDIRVG